MRTSDPSDARTGVVAHVNAGRAAAGAAPLAVDPLLERVGDAFALLLARESGTGHVSSDGVPPYLRYLLAGGHGFHMENVGTFESSPEPAEAQLPGIAGLLTREMLAERPPNDGHRRALVDPNATHIGVGLALVGGEVVMTHELACEATSEWAAPPLVARPGQPLRLTGRLVPPWTVAAAEVLWEPIPAPRSRHARPVVAYGYPPRRSIVFAHDDRLRSGNDGDRLAVEVSGRFTLMRYAGRAEGVEITVIWASTREGGRALTPVAAALSVVDRDGRLPANLAAWAELGER